MIADLSDIHVYCEVKYISRKIKMRLQNLSICAYKLFSAWVKLNVPIRRCKDDES